MLLLDAPRSLLPRSLASANGHGGKALHVAPVQCATRPKGFLIFGQKGYSGRFLFINWADPLSQVEDQERGKVTCGGGWKQSDNVNDYVVQYEPMKR